jgi:nucleoside-diphosphate-sugar epimerase
MRPKKIFVTGISGCVGHYLYDVLAADPDIHLFLLVRNPQKLQFSCEKNPRVELIHDSLEHIHLYADLLKQMDAAIHLAAGWGSRHAFRINVEQTLRFFSLLDPQRCGRVIYFSTASILGEDGRPGEAAEQYGTPYIRSKYRCCMKLPRLSIYRRIVTLFPTVILGGDRTHPYAHASRELKKIWKYLSLVKYLRIDGSFHFIHAHDIAVMVGHLLKQESSERRLILGNPPISLDQCIEKLCDTAGKKRRFAVNLTSFLVKVVPKVLKKRLSPWDLYSLRRRHFRYAAVFPASLGLPSAYDTLEKCIEK